MKSSVSYCLATLVASAVAAPWDLLKGQAERLEARDDTPTVDLGYEVHSSTVNVSTILVYTLEDTWF